MQHDFALAIVKMAARNAEPCYQCGQLTTGKITLSSVLQKPVIEQALCGECIKELWRATHTLTELEEGDVAWLELPLGDQYQVSTRVALNTDLETAWLYYLSYLSWLGTP